MKLKLDGWDLGITFAAAHFIPGHHKCARLHGHVYAINCEIEGDEGEDHMVMDFTEIKRFLREIADTLDHHVLVPGNGGEAQVEVKDDSVHVVVGDKRYQFPVEDCAIIDVPTTSAEELSRFILKWLMERVTFPPNISKISIGVDEGKGQGAWSQMEIL
jgi:6-pyruvoyltetrahydropterin/6-carboxytetrahydropterin synthase